jgi:hypothetical protein
LAQGISLSATARVGLCFSSHATRLGGAECKTFFFVNFIHQNSCSAEAKCSRTEGHSVITACVAALGNNDGLSRVASFDFPFRDYGFDLKKGRVGPALAFIGCKIILKWGRYGAEYRFCYTGIAPEAL